MTEKITAAHRPTRSLNSRRVSEYSRRGGGQHRDQADRPGGGQAADGIGERAEHGVQDRGTGEVRGVVALQRRAVEQVGQFQVAGVEVQGLVLERRVAASAGTGPPARTGWRAARRGSPRSGAGSAGGEPHRAEPCLPARQPEHPGAARPGEFRGPGAEAAWSRQLRSDCRVNLASITVLGPRPGQTGGRPVERVGRGAAVPADRAGRREAPGWRPPAHFRGLTSVSPARSPATAPARSAATRLASRHPACCSRTRRSRARPDAG